MVISGSYLVRRSIIFVSGEYIFLIISSLSALVALASCYGSTHNERHLWRVRHKKYDVMLVPREPFRGNAPAPVLLGLNNSGLWKYFKNQSFELIVIDNVIYWGNDIADAYTPNQALQALLITIYFEYGYITVKGKKKTRR